MSAFLRQRAAALLSIRDNDSSVLIARGSGCRASSRATSIRDRSALVALRKLLGSTPYTHALHPFPTGFRLSFLAAASGVDAVPHIHEVSGRQLHPRPPECRGSRLRTGAGRYALGRAKAVLVISTGMNRPDRPGRARWVSGELGHVLVWHASTAHAAHLLPARGADRVDAARIPRPEGIIFGFEEWFRKSELSCDRAGCSPRRTRRRRRGL